MYAKATINIINNEFEIATKNLLTEKVRSAISSPKRSGDPTYNSTNPRATRKLDKQFTRLFLDQRLMTKLMLQRTS